MYENDDFFIDTQYNLTFPIGFYYTSLSSYYGGLFTSNDFPFANGENSEFGGMKNKNTEFSPRLLNINISAGINAGKSFYINDRQIFIELHFKQLALVGLKSNDYWLYPENVSPYYWGFKIGYGF